MARTVQNRKQNYADGSARQNNWRKPLARVWSRNWVLKTKVTKWHASWQESEKLVAGGLGIHDVSETPELTV